MTQVADHNPDSFSMTLDAWSAKCHGYVGINAHYLHDWQRFTFHVYCQPDDESHTGEHIRGIMEENLRE